MNDDGQTFEESIDESHEVAQYEYVVTSYGADYPVDAIVKRLEQDDIFIPGFQRRFVWKQPQASRFIESLLLGLPVPGIFLGKQEETNRLLIIDGQQRLLTLRYFYEGVFAGSGRQFALKGVQDSLVGTTYRSLEEDQRRRLDDSIIHATIVRQEEPSGDDRSLYLVFERLNTGGTPLSAQEIRSCVSFGPYIDLLRSLNDFDKWRDIVGEPNARLKDQELILRFFAIHEDGTNYSRPMRSFLNFYIARNKNMTNDDAEKRRGLFEKTITTIYDALGKSAFRPKSALNVAVFDSVSVVVGEQIAAGRVFSDNEALRTAYSTLLKDEQFISAYSKSTTDENQLASRLSRARAILSAACSKR